ncbi:MAG: hypothetical protein U0793_20085 [Gemmataceae bacterium]
MASEKKSFINVDELMPQVSLEQVAQFYNVPLPTLSKIGEETRAACFLNCAKKEPTGDRALAIQCADPFKKWHCHQYGCGKGGNLVSLCDLLRPGANSGGRPRGERFKDIAADLQAMISGQVAAAVAAVLAAPKAAPPIEVKANVPLKDSENERARVLVDLDRKFVVDLGAMPPAASAYLRRRPYLSAEVCKAWRMGYLPRDVGGQDKSGGTMRGKIVYAYLNDAGEVLTWFGRDPEYEAKKEKWEKSERKDPAPEKFHFVKGFHRGVELYGVHQLRTPAAAEKLRTLQCLPLVEGPNDVIRLSILGVPAVALCGNRITREQALKVASLARELAGGTVGVFLDVDEEGLNGMRQCLGYVAQLCAVRLLWTDRMFGGRFKGKQPEGLGADDWEAIKTYLVTGKPEGWSLT